MWLEVKNDMSRGKNFTTVMNGLRDFSRYGASYKECQFFTASIFCCNLIAGIFVGSTVARSDFLWEFSSRRSYTRLLTHRDRESKTTTRRRQRLPFPLGFLLLVKTWGIYFWLKKKKTMVIVGSSMALRLTFYLDSFFYHWNIKYWLTPKF